MEQTIKDERSRLGMRSGCNHPRQRNSRAGRSLAFWSALSPMVPLLLLFLVTFLFGCQSKRALPVRTVQDWQVLAAATENEQSARLPDVARLIGKSVPRDDAMWPVDTFLRAEVYRLRGNTEEARTNYRALAQWGAADPYQDGSAGSGLSVIALWRWLEITSAAPVADKQAVTELLDCARNFQGKRLVTGMFSAPLLGTLPQIKEQAARKLAHLAWLDGRKDLAQRLFLLYLQFARSKDLRDLNEAEKQIWQNLVATGQASPDRLTLLVANRASALGQHAIAEEIFREILASDDPEVRAQAGYHLARLERLTGARRPILLNRLTVALQDAADPQLAQQILLYRAEVYNLPGNGRDSKRHLDDLQQLISDFPDGSLASNARYQIARYYQGANDIDQALKHFVALQTLPANNNRFELAHYEAALALYRRGDQGDLSKAAAMLEKLLEDRPNSAVRLGALFWLARLAERSEDTQKAQNYFRRIVEESPYDYYGIRSRMHLDEGAQARHTLLPDRKTYDQLRATYSPAPSNAGIAAESPYGIRIREALQTRLYADGIKATEHLQHLYPSARLENMTLQELDSAHLLARVGLLIAFREDADAAIAAHPEGRLGMAGALGNMGEDWPFAIALCNAKIQTGDRDSTSAQNARFLATAYPLVFASAFQKAANAANLEPEFLYSVARRESYFYPAALSPPPSGALGLFQFIPSTFASLDKRWKLLKESGKSTASEFLLDPDLSIGLGARWFRDELLPRNHGDLIAALVEHNASRRIALDWLSRVEKSGQKNDVEYAIESIPAMETRLFVKGVLGDMAIVTATGRLRK